MQPMRIRHKRTILPFFLNVFLLGNTCYALPFTITPAAPLPTQVIKGQTVTALYTVQNNTASMRTGNHVKYLPLNVTQATSDTTLTNICGSQFGLAPRGSTGDSCTLKLTVSGAVNGSDSDPHHHLFVCFPGDITCAGTTSPLNVTESSSPTPTPIPIPKFAYIANDDSATTISICSVNSNGALGTCTLQSNASFASPSDVILNSNGTRAYVLNTAGSEGVSSCAVDTTTGQLSSCTNTLIANIASGGLVILGNFLYVSSYDISAITKCPINLDGSLGTCATTGSNFDHPNGRIGFNPAGTKAYIANYNSNDITICNVNTTTGDFSGCTAGNGTFSNPLSVTVNAAGTYLYVPNDRFGSSPNTISVCPILATGLLGTCTLINGNATFALEDVVNVLISKTQVAYVPNPTNNTVSNCPVLTSGLFGTCTVNTGSGTLSSPTSAFLSYQ
jgi:6-phosphogluconolactonase (cycloisomerase 2 family)